MTRAQKKLAGRNLYQRLLLIAAAITAVVVLAAGERLWRLDIWFYDQLIQFKPWVTEADTRIAIVAIDEHSLAELGHWPWSRSLHAKAVRRLTEIGVKGIAIDIMFAETHGVDPDGDADLAAAIAENGRVVLPVSVIRHQRTGPMVELFPLPELAQSAAALGHVDIAQDHDGVTRGIFLRAGLTEPRWSTLALALLEGGEPYPDDALPGLRPPGADPESQHHWARDRYVLLPYSRSPGTIAHVSFTDLINDRIPGPLLRDRWILVGVTASGHGTTIFTPLTSGWDRTSGIEFHAHVLRMLLDDNAISHLSRAWHIAFACFFVLLPLVLFGNISMRSELTLVALTLILLPVASAVLLLGPGLWIGPSTPLVVLGAYLPLLLAFRLRGFWHLAVHDPMTGLANRHQLANAFEREWRSSLRSGQPVALLLIDVDSFKAFNDRYGHPRGDEALRTLAGVIKRAARRPRDLAARSGGEEFAIILPETGLKGAKHIAEALRLDVYNMSVKHADSPHQQRLTVSIGVHARVATREENAQVLYDSADRALYQAKEQGRNRVCTISPWPM